LKRQILIIDDEPDLVKLLTYNLKKQGYEVSAAHTGADGMSKVEAGFDGVVLLDLRLPDASGLDLIGPITEASGSNRIIVMTAHGSIDAAIDATRNGAYDFVSKTGDLLGRITVAVKNAFRDRDMATRVTALEEEVTGRYRFGMIIARSPQMRRVFETLQHVVESKVTLLITGESGTGKELVARAIHYNGIRRQGPFVAINCAGIPDALLESELFGHERGAFTGAVAAKKGKFELADGGTIFLDEIGEMPVHLQAKLLRVLQERMVERVGGTQPRSVDVRVISATNRNLKQMVEDQTFREDLFYRLAVFPVELPPLRQREGDIPLLSHHFLRKYAVEEGKTITGITASALRVLESYDFPGNVRELENTLSHAVVVASGKELSVADLPHSVVDATRRKHGGSPQAGNLLASMSLERAIDLIFDSAETLPALDAVEHALIRRAVKLCDGNIVQAANLLGLSRATMYRRLEKMGGKEAVLAD